MWAAGEPGLSLRDERGEEGLVKTEEGKLDLGKRDVAIEIVINETEVEQYLLGIVSTSDGKL